MVDDHRPGYSAPGVQHHVFEQSRFFRGQFDSRARPADGSTHAVHLQVFHAENGYRWAATPSQQGPHAGGKIPQTRTV